MKPKSAKDPLEGKIVYVLIMTLLVQFLFPLSVGSPYFQYAFQIFYMSLFVVGIYLVSANRRLRVFLAIVSLTWLIVAAIFSFNPDFFWANLVAYFLVGVFQSSLTFVLLRYIFRTSSVSLDVLLAACAVYLLLGAIFAAVFGTIETLTWFCDEVPFCQSAERTHAFIDGTNDIGEDIFPWQTLVYYSYATLSTLGYGDVLPVTNWARSAATLEAVVGVLYTAIIVARLVGLYAAKEVEEEFETENHHPQI